MLPYFIVIKCSAPSGASAKTYDLNLVMPSLEVLSSSDEEEDEVEGVGQMDVTQRDLRARKRCRRYKFCSHKRLTVLLSVSVSRTSASEAQHGAKSLFFVKFVLHIF